MTKSFFKKYAWFLTGYNVMVILWGAVVRATGSGAGCGNHWPLCNGEILPQPKEIDLVIEFAHRITSTLDGLLVILLVFFAYRLYGKKSPVFRWAVAALVFIIIEGLLGRMLVVREWVAGNVSLARAGVVAVHLANTYILLLTLTITAWLANLKVEIQWRRDKTVNVLITIGLVLGVLLSAMGAVTALGDTLFPKDSILSGEIDYVDPVSNFIVELRVIHPMLAIATSGYLYFVIRFLKNRKLGSRVDKRANWLLGVIVTQVLAGGFTILTLAPIVMQLLHLLLADVFWISLVLLSVEVFTTPRRKSGLGEGLV